jgi:ABC-type sugar transport system ATPase subunit
VTKSAIPYPGLSGAIMPTDIQNILEIRGVSKSFAGVEVLHSVDLDLIPGRVHAVVGENGAGKSTLIKILSGVHRRDGGTITVAGRPIETLSPHLAQSLGIVTIYQERNLIPYLSVGENILLGDVPVNRLGAVQWQRLFERAGEILKNLNLALNPRETVANLGPAEQQAVEIAKALYKQARLVIMDEPTASLTAAETENLFALICQLRDRNVAVIYISHRLDEIFAIADEVTVLRDGYQVLHCPIGEVTKEGLVKAMVGEEITVTQVAGSAAAGELLLDVQGLTRAGAFEDVSLSLQRGMIIGLAGALGSGRTNVLRALAGIEPATRGSFILNGTALQGKGLTEIIERGICFVPAERDQAGLILSMSVAGNTTLADLDAVTRGPFMDLGRERAVAQKAVRDLDIQAKSVYQEVQYLSGGNRQKVMLSKWLARGLEVFLLDEPTQGVDVGAREEIHQIMKKLLEQGKGILMVTSDLDELMNMSQFIAVMNRGRLVAYLDAKQTTREEVLSYAIGNS